MPTLKRTTKRKTKSSKRPLTLYLFNVGQGDHLLLELPDGTFGIIDFNYDSDKNPALEPPALSYLRYRHQNIRPVVISFICISHPDRDHTKGLEKMLRWITSTGIDVERLWLYPGIGKSEINDVLPARYRQLRVSADLAALSTFIKSWKKHSPSYLTGPNHLDDLGGNVQVCVIAPTGSQIKAVDKKILKGIVNREHDATKDAALHLGNLVSSVLKMRFAGHQLLFAGDTDKKIWSECLDAFEQKFINKNGACHPSCKANFIKISHHGAHTASSGKLWERILDVGCHVGISAGRAENLEHPHRETLAQISEASRKTGGAPARMLSTNICDSCVHRLELPTEDLPWPSLTRATPRKKYTKAAVNMESPTVSISGPNPLAAKALNSYRPRARKLSKRQPQTLAAYIYRFNSDLHGVQVAKATMDSPTLQECRYGYCGKKQFPECANWLSDL